MATNVGQATERLRLEPIGWDRVQARVDLHQDLRIAGITPDLRMRAAISAVTAAVLPPWRGWGSVMLTVQGAELHGGQNEQSTAQER